jgi:arabinofuranan 3-O-arabinosyltransferase
VRRAGRLDAAGLVLLALVAFLASDPGRVAADSRQYLYLDPGGFLGRATSLWDPSIAAGTVPHQHLGFLWPMGPWFWVADVVGLPVWVAQRLWMAAIVAVAGLGMLRLCRALGLSRVAALVAALCYQWTPYQLAFTARFSVLLLPWAALPWLVHLTRRALRERTWRAPIAFGLVAATAGSVNASSLALVLLAPATVLAAAVVAGGWRQALAAGGRIALVTAGASAWWIAGLVVQGRYGLPILQLTENVETVAGASTADDIVRGLGNWIFTSTDGAATALEQADAYQRSGPVRVATALLPAAALGALVLVRSRHRNRLLVLLAAATVIGVGAAPVGGSSRYGDLWRRFSESSSIGLALRNTPRIVPVVVLVVALAIAFGLDRIAGRLRTVAVGAAVLAIAVSISPVARHGMLAGDFDRPEEIPDHWLALADDLDAAGTDARVLELPGSNFAAYRWGNTVEPVLPGLVERPTIAREVLPAGGFGTVDLLAALDRGILHDRFEPAALAPVARLLGVGDVVIRGDLDATRFGLPDPARLVERFLTDPPPGFSVAGTYGGEPDAPLLLRLQLEDPSPRLRADAAAPVVVAGNGDGIVDAAAAGTIHGDRPVLPATTLDDRGLADAVARGGELVVTDTNRKRATTFFYTLVDDTGATELPDRTEPDPTGYDVRPGPYAETSTDAQTVVEHLGGTVTASMSGGPEHPEHRAVHAFDGDRRTVWRPQGPAVSQHVRARFAEPVSADELRITAAPGPAQVTSVAVVVDGVRSDVSLDERAQSRQGQPVPLPAGPVEEVAVEITGATEGGAPGLAEVSVGGAVVDEVVRTPVALVRRSAALPRAPVSYVLTRDRGDQVDDDPDVEVEIDRFVEVAHRSTFELEGHATADSAPTSGCDDTVLRVDGRAVPVRVGPVVDGSRPLSGCRRIRLDPGRHRITTARQGTVVVDQLVLEPPARAAGPAGLRPGLDLDVTDEGDRHLDARVDTGGDVFWLVLAESRNDGWALAVDGGTVVSTSMVDGYANGWLIRPDADRVGVTLRWEPQRLVWIGMAASVLTAMVGAGALLAGRGRGARGATGDPGERFARRSPSTSAAVTTAAAVIGVAWFVGGAAVAAVGLGALVLRLGWRHATPILAVVAAATPVVAELTDRPSLVFAGLAVAGAAAVGDVLRGQRPTEATAAAPG